MTQFQWKDPVSGSFDDPNNWKVLIATPDDTPPPPGASDSVSFSAGAYTVEVSGASAASIEIDGQTLHLGGSLNVGVLQSTTGFTLSGSGSVAADTISSWGNASIAADVAISARGANLKMSGPGLGEILVNGGPVSASGTLTLEYGGLRAINDAEITSGSGFLTGGGGGGTVDYHGSGALILSTLESGATWTIAHTLTLANAGAIAVRSGSELTAAAISFDVDSIFHSGGGVFGVDGGTATITGAVAQAAGSGGSVEVVGGGTLTTAGVTGKSGLYLYVSGTGSHWSNTGDVLLASGETGDSLTIFNHGVFNTTGNLTVGQGAGGYASVTVYSGGVLTAHAAKAGATSGASASIVVSGAGTKFTLSADLSIGDAGTASLDLTGAGAGQTATTLSDVNAVIDTGAGASLISEARITGIGALWTNSGTLTVGQAGHAGLDLANGARITSKAVIVGNLAGSDGKVFINGGASSWDVATDLTVASKAGSDGAISIGTFDPHHLGQEKLTVQGNFFGGRGGDAILTFGSGTVTVKRDMTLALDASSSAQILGVENGTAKLSISGKLIFGLGDTTLNTKTISVAVGTSAFEAKALHLSATGLLQVGVLGHQESAAKIDGDISNDASGSNSGIDLRGGTLTVTGEMRGDGLVKIDENAKLLLSGSEEASIKAQEGNAALSVLHDKSNNDTFDYTDDKFDHFDDGARQLIDGGTETASSGVNDGHDLLKLAGRPSDYRILTVLDDTWHETSTNLTHYDPGDAAYANPLHYITTNDVEKAEYDDPTVTNEVTVANGSVYVEMAALAAMSYLGDATIYDNLNERGWRPLSAIELGIKPSDFGEGSVQYQFVNGIYHAKSNKLLLWSTESDALVATGVVNGKATLAIAFRGTDEGVNNELPAYRDMQATFRQDFGVLIDALKDYIAEYGIKQVLITGHSLGSSMTQAMLTEADFNGSKYMGFGFASPGAEDSSTAADQMVNLIHTGDAIRAAALPKHTSGPIVWINSLTANGNPVQQHDMDTYLSDTQNLALLATDTASPFFSSDLASAFREDRVYQGPSVQVAPGTSNADVINAAPRLGDFNLAQDKYILAGGGNDRISINGSAGLISQVSGRAIDGGGGADTLLTIYWDSSHFKLKHVGDHVRLNYDGKLVADLYRIETLRFHDREILVNGDAANVQKPGANSDTLKLDMSHDYADTGNRDGLNITGTGGADTLYIGHGQMKAKMGNGDDTVIARFDAPAAGKAASSDALKLDGGNGNDMLGAGAGNDKLTGGVGNDTLDGGRGTDKLTGGTGDDVYFVRDSGDKVVEGVNAGSDRVIASVTFTLSANTENLSLSLDAKAINGTGNGLANQIDGNDSANKLTGKAGGDTLTGGAGNDKLCGGAGNDMLVGGKGHDSFIFDTALSAETNVDRIADFSHGDLIRLDHDIFKGLATGALADDAFHLGTKAGDAEDRIIYDKAHGELFFDRDGTGHAYALVKFATVFDNVVLASTDFSVV